MQPLLEWESSKYYTLWVSIHKLSYLACAVLSSVAWPALKYFSKLSHKRHDFREGEGKLLNIRCMLSFSLQHVRNIAYPRSRRRKIVNV